MQTYQEVLASLPWEAQRYFTYLWENMPASDRDNYPPALFGAFARHAAFLRRRMPWCAELDETLFLDYVLFHRVNDEDISFHRELFYGILNSRVRALSLERAVLEVNRWCNEICAYGQRDDRTASPLSVYFSGVGRCGEESAFAVSALRSVGIPARQVYAPRWSHCDDNHAWVEAWCGNRWRFFGACEPEPVLDRGWFNSAATRAVLIHTRRFVKPGAEEAPHIHGEMLGRQGPAVFYNQTKRYAAVKRYRFQVVQDRRPVSGAVIHVELLNEASLYPVLTLTTDETGAASVELGAGSYHLRVHHALGRAEQMCNGLEHSEFIIQLGSGLFLEEAWWAFDFIAPSVTHKTTPLTEAQKQQRTQQLQWGNITRMRRIEAFITEDKAMSFGTDAAPILRAARGNVREITTLLTADNHPLRLALLRGLPEKDLCDTPAAVLEDHFQGAAAFERRYPDRVFREALLCPRIANEKLTPWRAALSKAYDKERRENYLQNPVKLWWDLCAVESQEDDYPNLYWLPESALETGRWDDKSRALLFVALLRSWGLPARLCLWDGEPEYWNGTAFAPVEQKGHAVLTLRKRPDELLTYRQDWNLARRTAAGWQMLMLGEPEWEQNILRLSLSLGRYRLLTAARLPNGNQYASRYDMNFKENVVMSLQLRRYQLRDSLARHTLPAFTVQDQKGDRVSLPADVSGRKLLLWLMPGEEPTEHILNELLELHHGPTQIHSPVFIFLPDRQAANDPVLKKVSEAYDNVHLCYGDWTYNIDLVGRALFCDPDCPPLAVCCDGEDNAVYALSGYNVGIVELLTQIMWLL